MNNTSLKTRMNTKVQAMEAAQPEDLWNPTGSGYLALTSNALDLIKENLKQQPLSFQLFDLVKSPSGGSTVFSVPGLSGEEAEKELTGIILDYMTPRAYWATSDPVEGMPPTCLSKDSLISADGKVCAHCPCNDFGSKDGESNAKACKESVLLFLLRPGSVFPLLVRVPVTSKKLFLKYTTRLVSRLTPLSSVVTKITLEKATSREGKPYALFHFDAVEVLGSEEAEKVREFGRQFMDIVHAADVEPVFTEAD
mgnify:FL=1